MPYLSERNYINRELSWLEFNYRVLQEAMDPELPALERMKYISIFSSNLDEFFMVRVASIKDQVTLGFLEEDASGLSPQQQLKLISKKTHELVNQQYSYYTEQLLPVLVKNDIVLSSYNELGEEEKLEADKVFDEMIYPVLTPMAVDFSRPFPLISNRSLNICAFIHDPSKPDETFFATVQVPQKLSRLVKLKAKKKGQQQFIFLEDLIQKNIYKLFYGKKVLESHVYRITRNADLSVSDDDAEDLLLVIEKSLRQRRWGNVVRLEVSNTIGGKMLKILKDALSIKSAEVYVINGPIDLTFANSLCDNPKLEHLMQRRQPRFHPADFYGKEDLFLAIQERDLMIHLPYETFDPVVDFIKQAAQDPDVLAIKQTLYRVSGNSPILKALAEAAELGKQVTVLVEIRARFDEENNITWAKRLERSGCHIIYGFEGLKTHAKMCMVVRREDGKIRRYVHFSTGNYNDVTAKFYTDIGFFTCDKELAEDATEFFNTLSGYSDPLDMYKLTVAPYGLRRKLIDLIDREIRFATEGKAARIVIKVNALVDPEMVSKLYEASQAGVQVSLVVRGVCCLIPGLPELSEHIEVISIVGTYLEHSRIAYFENDGQPEVFITSADLMERNLDRRVELLIPVTDAQIKQRIIDILAIYLRDNVKARMMQPDGGYAYRVGGEEKINSQQLLSSLAKKYNQSQLEQQKKHYLID